MNTRRYRPFAMLTAGAGLALAVLAGCAGTGTSGAGAPGTGGGTAAGTAAPSAPGTGASGAAGGGPSGGAGAPGGVAQPVPVASLTCGTSPATMPGPLPQHSWTRVVSCPVHAMVGPGGTTGARPSPPVVGRGDPGPLVNALNQPDAPRTHGVCPDYRVLLPTFWLVDAQGQAYQPRIPTNSCGQPSDKVVTALRDLGLT